MNRFFFIVLGAFLLFGCGSKSQTLDIQYTGADPFGNTSVVDVVYCAQNIPVGGLGLDENNDSVPDLFLFPAGCGLAANCGVMKTNGCGYPVSTSGSVTLGDLPTGFQYEFRAEFRDGSGNVLFCGEQTLNNDVGFSQLTLNMTNGSCP